MSEIINKSIDTIETAIEAFRNGKPIIVMDDEDRENEGDIIVPAEDVTEEMMAMIINETTGILCAPMPEPLADKLGFYPMLARNNDPKGTAFTVTTDLKPTLDSDSKLKDMFNNETETGLTTGVSAMDRALTFKALANPNATLNDFNRPGHIFPLRAKRGGVLERRGHTEASVDLCRLAGKHPVGIIGELTNPDGSMKRLDDCKKLAIKYNMPIVTIDDLAAHLTKYPLFTPPPTCNVEFAAECTIPITKRNKYLGEWKMKCFRENGHNEHIVMTLGDIESCDKPIPIRIHSECFTGDLLGSMKCDCGDQLTEAFFRIAEEGVGIIMYLTGHEGRGIGLVNKMKAYNLQAEKGYDTYQANRELGFDDDMRDFDACVEIIKLLGIKNNTIQVLTNSPLKHAAMMALHNNNDTGLTIVAVPLLCAHNEFNSKYISDKRNHEKSLMERFSDSKNKNSDGQEEETRVSNAAKRCNIEIRG